MSHSVSIINESSKENNCDKGPFHDISKSESEKSKSYYGNTLDENNKKCIINGNAGKKNKRGGSDNNENYSDLTDNLHIYFIIDDKKLHIEAEKEKKFEEIIKELYYKHGWLKKKKISYFELNGKKLNENLTSSQNNIPNNAVININFY